ncbi:uncharacterized protein [Clytia hemisphaerica]|uniref:Nucleoporin NUP42 n=1 Tax=Clytia hemisphaerica TaxID=252671 RepID=A0A7M5X0R3_9CNID|eukprot:TCONS_00056844-protein
MNDGEGVVVDISQERKVITKNTGELQINFSNSQIRGDDDNTDSNGSAKNPQSTDKDVIIANSCNSEQEKDQTNKSEKKKNSTRICNKFSKAGKCNKGDECRFRHVLKEQTAASTESPQPSTEDLHQSSTEELPKPSPVKTCKYFQSQMGCKFDDDCSYQHYRGEVDAADETHLNQNESVELKPNNALHSDDTINNILKVLAERNDNSQSHKDTNEINNVSGDKNASVSKPTNTEVKNDIGYHPTIPRSRDDKLICKFFLSEHGCDRTNCRFIHVRKKGGSVPTSPIKEDIPENLNSDTVNKDTGQIDFQQNDGNAIVDEMKNEEGQSASNDGKNNQVVCKFFNTKKSCYKKLKCPNLHVSDGKDKNSNQSIDKSNAKEVTQNDDTKDKDNIEKKMEKLQVTDKKDEPKKQRRCRYFAKDLNCKQGDKCGFLHDISTTGTDSLPAKKEEKSQEELRAIEIKQLEKRWKGNYECLEKEPISIYKVSITPTDPDWPFVVKLFVLHVEFPEKYPDKMLKLKLVDSDQYPPHFAGYMNEALFDWCTDRFKDYGAGLHFRPFCKWFDKHLKQLFELSATKVKLQLQAEQAGIQLVHHRNIIQKSQQLESKDEDEEEKEKEDEIVNGKEETASMQETNEASKADQNLLDVATGGCDEDTNSMFGTQETAGSSKNNNDKYKCSENVKKGTEIKLPNLQIGDKIGTLRIRSCLVQLICERCKSKHDFKLESKQSLSKRCSKCSQTLNATYYSELVHQFSPVAGYLHLQGCIAFDLILNDCTIILNCIDCQKDNILRALTRGSKKDHWCQYCHVKMDLQIPTIKFYNLQPVFGGGKQTMMKKEIETKKKKNVLREPGIKEGQPLPDTGTCKHYKKSHRWLRFPCCGKAFPCDICHEEGVAGDHEMKVANRMICGYCSKEQPFSKDKPCTSCKSGVIKGHSTHWEGGQGCRDKSKMARGDKHKTAGLGKTISRKKEDLKPNKKK